MSHSTKKLDLAGQRFGKLVVTGPAANIGDRTAWLCRCDCGREAVVKTVRLRRGSVKSCGCDRKYYDEIARASLTFIDGTCVEMIRANTIRKNNTSGVPGVDWWASRQIWRASICFKGQRYYLGSYHRLEDAVEARKQAEKELFGCFLQEVAQSADGA